MDTTIDKILNHQVVIEQPRDGYRMAVDTVLLAAAVPAKANDKVLDMGCGVGGAMLCLAYRVPGISALGVDIQGELIDICRKNIRANQMKADMQAEVEDVTELKSADFDHVLMNPPYHDEARHGASDNKIKRIANTEKKGDLSLWIANAFISLKPNGMVTLIHRADRLNDILVHMKPFGSIQILPILSKVGVAPKRIIVRGRKDGKNEVKSATPFILYKPAGGYSDAAEGVLRHARAIEFDII